MGIEHAFNLLFELISQNDSSYRLLRMLGPRSKKQTCPLRLESNYLTSSRFGVISSGTESSENLRIATGAFQGTALRVTSSGYSLFFLFASTSIALAEPSNFDVESSVFYLVSA